MGPDNSRRISRVPRYSGLTVGFTRLHVRSFHALRPNFPDGSVRIDLAVSRSYNPNRAVTRLVWAGPRSLATTGGITFCFLLLQVIRCFSSLRLPPLFLGDAEFLNPAGCPIRRSPDQWICAPPRSFSQLITSFIASKSLGIHHAPFYTFSPTSHADQAFNA